jgi:hypothetical protein
MNKSALLIGLDPDILDYSSPDYAHFPGLTAAKLHAVFASDLAALKELGIEGEMGLIDFGDTAEAVTIARLQAKRWDCVLIGAGVRTTLTQFALFEKMINVVHCHAPQARICFNTGPNDSVAAVKRWLL